MNTETNNTNNAVAYNQTLKFEGARVHFKETYTNNDGNVVLKKANVELGGIEGSITIDNAGWVENLRSGVAVFCCLIKEAPGAVLPIIKTLVEFAKYCKEEAKAERIAEREARMETRKDEAFERNMNRAHEIKLHELRIREAEIRNDKLRAELTPEED